MDVQVQDSIKWHFDGPVQNTLSVFRINDLFIYTIVTDAYIHMVTQIPIAWIHVFIYSLLLCMALALCGNSLQARIKWSSNMLLFLL